MKPSRTSHSRVVEERLKTASKSMIRAMAEITVKPAIREIKVPNREPTCLIPARAKTAPTAHEVDAIRAKITPSIGSDIS
jgi:hypothetical protein